MPDEEKRGTASERVDENDFRQELKLADKLAIERTVLAADRTMLAGVRTSIAFIGFGFTIFNVLKYVQEHSLLTVMRPHTPRNIGGVMLLAGVIPLFALIFQYSRSSFRGLRVSYGPLSIFVSMSDKSKRQCGCCFLFAVASDS